MFTITKEQMEKAQEQARAVKDGISPAQSRKRDAMESKTLYDAVMDSRRERAEILPQNYRYAVVTKSVNYGTKKWPDIRKITRCEQVEKVTEKSVITFGAGETHRTRLDEVVAWVME